jgi:hypothetical protein
VVLPDGSSISAAPFSHIPACFVDEPIEMAGLNVSDKLPVPFLGVKLSKPDSERRPLFVGEPPYGFSDLLNNAHI